MHPLDRYPEPCAVGGYQDARYRLDPVPGAGPQAIALDGPDCARSCSCGQKGGVGSFQYPVQKLFHADPEWEAYQPIAD